MQKYGTLDYLEARFGGPPNKDKWIAAYEAHTEDVKQNVPAERLLIYRVQEGWEPICDFLSLPVPDSDFPRLNVGGEESLRTRLKSFFGAG